MTHARVTGSFDRDQKAKSYVLRREIVATTGLKWVCRENGIMRMTPFLAAAALSVAGMAPGEAAPVNVAVSFDRVSGIFYGLDDADGTTSATRFDVTTSRDSYTGVDATGAAANAFSFSGGVLTSVNFLLYAGSPDPVGIAGDMSDWFLTQLEITSGGFLLENLEGQGAGSGQFNVGPVTFEVRDAPAIPAPAIPVPASAVLMLSALAGVAGVQRCKPRAAPRAA